RDAVERHADRGAVVRPERVELIDHQQPAGGRLVLHDDARRARDMRTDMARHEAGEQIVGAARRRADDEAELLAAVKVRDVAGGMGGDEPRHCEERSDEAIQAEPPNWIASRSLSWGRPLRAGPDGSQ